MLQDRTYYNFADDDSVTFPSIFMFTHRLPGTLVQKASFEVYNNHSKDPKLFSVQRISDSESEIPK